MKINLDERIKASLESGKTFEEQLAEAKASGKRFATAHVGDKRAVYYHTAEELEHFKTYASPPPKPTEIDLLKARIEALESQKTP